MLLVVVVAVVVVTAIVATVVISTATMKLRASLQILLTLVLAFGAVFRCCCC